MILRSSIVPTVQLLLYHCQYKPKREFLKQSKREVKVQYTPGQERSEEEVVAGTDDDLAGREVRSELLVCFESKLWVT